MTIEKDYAKQREDDQQVPDSSFNILTKDSGAIVFEQKVTQGIPDFDTLLTDLAAVGALDCQEESLTSTTASNQTPQLDINQTPQLDTSLNLDSSQDLMDLYTERSFYDDYGTVTIKKEPCVDSKTVELALMKTASPPQPTSHPSQDNLYHNDLSLLSEETSYNYSYQTVRVPTEASNLDVQAISGEDLNLTTVDPLPENNYETLQKIDHASVELGISKNPYEWEPEHSHRWVEWTLKLYNLPVSYAGDFFMDGTNMCLLSIEDFQKRCPQFGDCLYVELDLWKSAYSFISSPLHGSSSSATSSDDEEPSYTNLDDMSNSSHSFPSLSGPSPYISQPLTSSSSSTAAPVSSIPTTLSSIPTPVIISPNHQMAAPTSSTSHYSSSAFTGSTHREPLLSQTAHVHHHRMMVGGMSRTLQPCVSPAPSLDSQGSSGQASWTSSPTAMHDDRHDADHISSLLADSTCSEPPHMGRGKHAIHLWQFLKELLLQPHAYHNCIRWLDRPKGIFKIEDSSRVAKLWGQRKNRPAMNYDKLSRSIRQYYKKGIIKKTENSKRLVYQFQPQYR